MIRQAQGRLAQASSLLRHRFRLRCAVEHGVLGVIVKMHEGVGSHVLILSVLAFKGSRPTLAQVAGMNSIRPRIQGCQPFTQAGFLKSSKALAKSGGYGERTLVNTPVRGWAKDRLTAWSHWRSKPRRSAVLGSAP